MGHKGVSKRKPKKSKSSSNDSSGDSSNLRLGENPVGQTLVNVNDAVLNNSSSHPSTASNKKNRKGK